MAFNVRLRWPVIDRRIEARGGMMAVTAKAGLHRSTLSRWRTRSALPNDPLQFLRLARALDLDPLLLFEVEPVRFPALCVEVGRLLLAGKLGSALRSLGFIEAFWACAGQEWPPESMESPAGKVHLAWHTVDLIHEGQLGEGAAGRNFYASILLDGSRVRTRDAPHVWHFAYRDRVGAAALWHPYGAVALVDGHLELFAYQGHTERRPVEGPIAVESWFGEGDADFRLASLHPFSAEVVRSLPAGCTAVRFSLPRKQRVAPRLVASGE